MQNAESDKDAVSSISDIELRLLNVFRAVVEAGSFTLAAPTLGVGKSTVSVHMAELEDRLGIRLCERGRGGFRLTADGRQVYEEALVLLSSVDRFRAQINRIHGQIAGAVNIGIIDNMIFDPEFRLSDTFERFSDVAPKVKLKLSVMPPEAIENALLSNQIQIGVLPVLKKLAGLSYEHLYEEANYLYCGRKHPFYELTDSAIDETTLRNAMYVRKFAVSKGLIEAERFFRSTASAVDIEAILFFLLSGRHIGFLPEKYAELWVKKKQLRRLLPDRFTAGVDLYLVFNSSIQQALPTEVFLDAFRECR